MTSSATAVLHSISSESSPKLGLEDAYREDMANRLSDLLAGNYRLMIKNHVYHWNVVGPIFVSFHELTEKHYNQLFKSADELAERIRALGHLAPVSTKKLEMFSDEGPLIDNASTADMLGDLINSHEKTVRNLRETAEVAAEAGDLVTEDLLTEFLGFHEQALWMLRSIAAE